MGQRAALVQVMDVQIVYLNGAFVPLSEARIPVLDADRARAGSLGASIVHPRRAASARTASLCWPSVGALRANTAGSAYSSTGCGAIGACWALPVTGRGGRPRDEQRRGHRTGE